MNLRHLEVFCAVVECETFSGAAERLRMTQPAASMQVHVVERHFGIQLLERRRSRAVLTEGGAVVYEWACNVLRTELETTQAVEDLKRVDSCRLVVGTSMSVGSYLLPPILSRFKREHAGAEIAVRFGDWESICADIRAGKTDFGVLIARSVPDGLVMEIVGSDRMIFICTPSHHLADRPRVSVAELANESFILAPRGSSYRVLVDTLLARCGLGGVSVHMELDGDQGLKQGVLQGLGIGLGLRSALKWELEQGVVRELRVDSAPMYVDVGVMSRPHDRESPMTEAFRPYLIEQLRQHLTERPVMQEREAKVETP